MKKALLFGSLLGIALACGPPPEDPILRLSAAEAFAEGKRLMEEEKYERAREYFSHAFDVEPNSAEGREALLLSADAYFLAGGRDNYVKAEAKYRDFQNRFPTSDRSAYVQFQIANSLERRVRDPDRDQSATRKALAAYEDLLRLYPSSEYVSEAEVKIGEVREVLAAHEFLIGRFNYRRRLYKAAVTRLGGLLEEYPDYSNREEAYFLLGQSHLALRQIDEAKSAFEQLRQEHPQSAFLAKVPKKYPEPRPEEPEEDEAPAEEEEAR